ncbi:MAG: ISH6 family transposase [Planctomycetota bacterium]
MGRTILPPATCVASARWAVERDLVGRDRRGHPQEDGDDGGAGKRPAKILVSDGEPALAEALAHVANGQQRSHWHTVRSLDWTMWQDEATKDERRATQKRLAGVLGIELPEEEFEHVADEDKAAIEQEVEDAEEKLDELIGELSGKGYTKAASYVRNAKDRLFTYVRFWLATGLISPRASSMIERMMREIGRRLKKIAFGWRESGAAKIARIIIKRITTAGEWEAYWKRRLRIRGNVVLFYRGVKAAR